MSVTRRSYENHQLFLSTLTEPLLAEGYTFGIFAPAQLSLSQGFADDACIFLFLRAQLTALDLTVLEQQLKQYLLAPARSQVRFLWLENPDQSLAQWRSHSLSAQQQGDGLIVTQLSYLDLHNYSFSVARGTIISLDEEKTPSQFILTRESINNQGFELATGYGEHRFYTIGETVRLPMQGEFTGCFKFDFHVEKKGSQTEVFGYPDLAHLDIGFRLFMRDPNFPELGNDVYLSSHHYPLVDEDSENDHGYGYYPETIAFTVCLDLLYPLAPERTYFSFQPLNDATFIQTGLPSAYRTNLGYSVHLLPIGDQSRLQFALRPAQSLRLDDPQAQRQTPLYLTPQGPYAIAVPRYQADGRVDLVAEANVICGISGLEYIKVVTGSLAQFIFVPEQPAHAAAYTSVNALLRDLPTILERFSRRRLPPDTTDLDLEIEALEASGGLGITDTERTEILEILRQDYFPPRYQFSQAQLDKYNNLVIVEDLIEWLRITLQAATFDEGEKASALTAYPTTAWTYVQAANGAVYYAQPDQAPLYKAEVSSQQFLDYLEIPSVGLPASLAETQRQSLEDITGVNSLAFPMLPYGNVESQSLADIRQLEISLVNNYRRDRIHRISQVTDHTTSLKAPTGKQPIGTTPQGLIATFSADCKDIERLQLMKDTKNQVIPFIDIQHGSPLKSALQSNQLFMIISDPAAVNDNFATSKLAAIGNVTNAPDIQNWVFELGTEHWAKNDTLLIFKFHDQPLLDLAENPDLWSLADEFNQDKTKVSQTLIRLLKQAVEIGKSADPKQRRKYEVLARAATQANWTGVLALNVHVPLGNLPNALKALAAGLDPDLFYAQYIGVEVTPVESTGAALVPQKSSLFGLIDYSNPNIPLADASGYNFHVPLLSVVFQNSEITDFAAEVLLILDRLFDEATILENSPDGKNIVRLQGVAEEHNGKVTYSFGFSGANHFLLSGKVLQEVAIIKAQFVTDSIPDSKANPLPITGRFFFWSRVQFAYRSEFDLLSFGPLPGTDVAAIPTPGEEPPPPDYLSMSNLQIVMSFELHDTTEFDEATQEQKTITTVKNREFEFDPNQLAFDLNRSGWREHSLYEKFPLKFSGLRTIKNDPQALEKSGFMPVKAPGKSVELGNNWYGLTYELNLGSAGALAGSAGLVVSILAAWVPEQDGIYVGLKLPGSSGGKKEIVIQGLLKISFKSIEFVVYPTNANTSIESPNGLEERDVGYLLKIKNIILKFLILSFPPSGQTEFILFGDPRDEIDRKDKLLGWYAAYAKAD